MSKDQSNIKADDEDGIQNTVIPPQPPSVIPPPVFKGDDGLHKTVKASTPSKLPLNPQATPFWPFIPPPPSMLSQTTPFSFPTPPFIPPPPSMLSRTTPFSPFIPPPPSMLSQTTSFPRGLPQTADLTGVAPVSSSNITLPSPFLNSASRKPTASIASIPPNPYPLTSPMLARPPGSWHRPMPRPTPLPRPEFTGPFHASAQGWPIPSTPLHKSQPPTETPVGPIGASFVNSTASGKQSAVSSVTDPGLPPAAACNDKPVSINVGAPSVEQSDTQTAYQTERCNDKPVSDVSVKVGTPAVEQSDAWTAYKTETGPVFYYNAVTGISTCEKPVEFKGEQSMSVQECYACLVRGLPESTTTEQVRKLFSQFGRILDAMVLMNNFTDVSTGDAYVIFETRAARRAAMGCSGTFFGRDMILVSDAKEGIGLNAYEFEDGHFNECITIGECRERRPTKWPGCGGSSPRERNTNAGNLGRSPKRLCCDGP